jgi:hypothetical protein
MMPVTVAVMEPPSLPSSPPVVAPGVITVGEAKSPEHNNAVPERPSSKRRKSPRNTNVCQQQETGNAAVCVAGLDWLDSILF